MKPLADIRAIAIKFNLNIHQISFNFAVSRTSNCFRKSTQIRPEVVFTRSIDLQSLNFGTNWCFSWSCDTFIHMQ